MSKVLEAQALDSAAGGPWARMRADWQGNARLRMGVWLILAMAWGWGLLLAQDQVKAWRTATLEAQEASQRLKPLQSQALWPQRADDAEHHLNLVKAQLWQMSSRGVAEAAVQDQVKGWAEKAGLTVKELQVLPDNGTRKGPGTIAMVRLRVALEGSNRLALVGFLSEMERLNQRVMLDALRLRLTTPPLRADLELRLPFTAEEGAP